MYVLWMHNTYICVYVCMYTNANQIYNARKVTPKCESEVRDVCMYALNEFFKYNYTFNFLNGLVRARIPIDSPLVRMHRGTVT